MEKNQRFLTELREIRDKEVAALWYGWIHVDVLQKLAYPVSFRLELLCQGLPIRVLFAHLRRFNLEADGNRLLDRCWASVHTVLMDQL